MVTIKEIKSTIAVAIAAAFGFIIALIWKDVIVGIVNDAGLGVAEPTNMTQVVESRNSSNNNNYLCSWDSLYLKMGRRSTKVETPPSFFFKKTNYSSFIRYIHIFSVGVNILVLRVNLQRHLVGPVL